MFNENQAKRWAAEHYKNIVIDDNVVKVIAKYCKENEPKINLALRNNKVNDEIMNEIKVLDEFLRKQYLNVPIVVFRLVNFNPFKDNNVFTEKGFMSTSLVNSDAINCIHNYAYRLRIYLPSGTRGFYVNFISCREDEYEFLLPRETTIHYLKDYLAKDGKHEFECYLDMKKL